MSKTVIRKMIKTTGLLALYRTLTRDKARIVMYHGLTKDSDNLDWTQVNLQNFSAQMRHVKKHFDPVPLEVMVAMLEAGSIEPKTIAVTFDDGYKSNYDLAYPILEELEIPATIFITSNFVLRRLKCTPFLWPDFITVLMKSIDDESIDLSEFGLGKYSLASMRNIYDSRNAICEYLKSISSTEKDRIISGLYDKYDKIIDHDRFPGYKPMSVDEIKRLAASRLITIGAHTRSHPILSHLETGMLEDEIYGSKNDLEEITGSPVTEFAYPNGRFQDINEQALEMTARKFNCALTTETGLNVVGQNKYLLLRIGIGSNIDIIHFQTMLAGVGFEGQKPVRRFEDVRRI